MKLPRIRLRKPNKRVVKVTIIAWMIYLALSICTYSRVNEPLCSDAVVVLGAAVSGDQPSPVFRERINHGIDLYWDGYADKLILTGGSRSKKGVADSEIARRYAVGKGVPWDDILIEKRSHFTEQNLINAKQIAERNGLKSFIIVSDPLHMKRSMLMARDVGMDAYPSPTPTTRYRSTSNKLQFLASEVFDYNIYLILKPFR